MTLIAAAACLYAFCALSGTNLNHKASCPITAGKVSEPEIFPRADGTVWCCGENSMVTPPEDPLQVAPRPGASAAIQVCVC